MNQPIVVVVLGMHRSFTSATARLLTLAGAGIAPVLIEANSANPAGYWESGRLNMVNDGILRKLGRSWHDWRPLPRGWESVLDDAAAVAEMREDLAQTMQAAPVSVVKEPRLCRLFPMWRTAVAPLNADLRVVLPIRSPLDVAASLEHRDGLAHPRSFLLWLRYVLEAEEASRGLPRVFVDGSRLMVDWRPGLARMIAALDLPLDAGKAADAGGFIDSRLIHHASDGAEPLPPWVADCHGILLDMVGRDTATARRRLTGIRSRLDDFCAQFGDYVAALEPNPETLALTRAAEHLMQAISEESGEDRALDSFLEAAKRRPAEALAALAPVMSWHGENPWALRAVGLTALDGHNLPRALEALHRLDTRGMANSRDLVCLGWTLINLERWSEAQAVAGRAVAAEPDEVAGLFLLASVHQRTGNRQAARAIAATLVERHPDFSAGRVLLDQLSG